MSEQKKEQGQNKGTQKPKPIEVITVQTIVKNLNNYEDKVYLEGIVADFTKIRQMTGIERFTVNVWVAFKVLGNDDKYKIIKSETYQIQ